MVDDYYWACASRFQRPHFVPNFINVRVGDTVTWAWSGGSLHSTTSDTGEWDSGAHVAPFTFSHTFTQAGTFPYHCSPGYQERITRNGGCIRVPEHESGVVIVGP